ncbi:uncharacterized protein LOC127845126 isoform X2 [Dreissena polymorpha]|uniref:uncharacterized protein LOC127845126 isoform X2 n=1 Tax=Dreissena polymorpha TaxID=45954 RepID=UPI002264E0A7|nr:uncharacterized protein LOC127845126 isoform X2 [Dreissena polymorpha]
MERKTNKSKSGEETEVKSSILTSSKYQSSVDLDMEKEFKQIYEQAKRLGLTVKDFKTISVLQKIDWDVSPCKLFLQIVLAVLSVVLVVQCSLVFTVLLDWPISHETLAQAWFNIYQSDAEFEQCVVYMPETLHTLFRPPVECSFCKGLKEVQTVNNINQEEFERLYAYSGVPVVIGDGTVNWTAPKHFSFEFFRNLYRPGSQALENQQRKCQFFPYKSNFTRLEEVLEMSDDRAHMRDGSTPWYIGWSNCDFKTANLLRQHYQRPYFLPRLSESSKTDWMFMGSPGYGAHLHIDNVEKPSWQAQITGTKRWTLEPPPECYDVCENRLHVTVHPGQITLLAEGLKSLCHGVVSVVRPSLYLTRTFGTTLH